MIIIVQYIEITSNEGNKIGIAGLTNALPCATKFLQEQELLHIQAIQMILR